MLDRERPLISAASAADRDCPRASDASPAWPSSIVPIRRRGWRPPLLWIDLCLELVPLFRSLGPDQPVVAVSVDNLRSSVDIPGFARQLAAVICAEYPQPSYNLGGYCTLGMVAYELAHQLRAAGKSVPVIVMVDTVNPGAAPSSSLARMLWSHTIYHFRQIFRKAKKDRAAYVLGRLKGLARLLGLAPPAPSPWLPHSIRAEIERAAYRYSAPTTELNVVLLQPSERIEVYDRAASWVNVVRGGLEVHDLPGQHVTMMRVPNVHVMAGLIRDAVLSAHVDARPT